MRKLTEGLLSNLGVVLVEEMRRWCEEMGLKKFTIEDGKINIGKDGHTYMMTLARKVDENELEELPYPFGKVDCDFRLGVYDSKIKSLKNCPEEVTGDFDCSYCKKLESLEGSPKIIGGVFDCRYCTKLKSLKSNIDKVSSFNCNGCDSLKSLEGAPEITKSFFCDWCKGLKSLKGAPKQCKYRFSCKDCYNLTSLKGAPTFVEISFDCSGCNKLPTLEGAPKEVGTFICERCSSLKSIGTPFKVNVMFYYSGCRKLEISKEFKKNVCFNV